MIRIDAAVFAHLLDQMRAAGAKGDVPPAIWQTVGSDFPTTAAYFLLDIEAEENGVEPYATITLPRLQQQLVRNTERRLVEHRSQVRGRVVWAATQKARHNRDYDPSRYVCREVRREYDTLENQLVKYMIAQIERCLAAVPEWIWNGVCYMPGRPPAFTAERLGRIESALHNLARNVRLREITLPTRITQQHLHKAAIAHDRGYHQTAHLYQQYVQTVLKPTWATIQKSGQRALPLPARTGTRENGWIDLGAAILRRE